MNILFITSLSLIMTSQLICMKLYPSKNEILCWVIGNTTGIVGTAIVFFPEIFGG